MTQKIEKLILIDADSINKNLRNILIKAAQRTQIKFVFVADRQLNDIIGAKNRKVTVDMKIVPQGADSADNYIFENKDKMYFCISHDVLLAYRLAECGITTIDRYGEIINRDNANLKKSIRNTNQVLREEGVFENSKTRKQTTKDVEKFSNSLDKLLNKVIKEN